MEEEHTKPIWNHSGRDWHSGRPLSETYVRCVDCGDEITTNGILTDEQAVAEFVRHGWQLLGYGEWKCPRNSDAKPSLA